MTPQQREQIRIAARELVATWGSLPSPPATALNRTAALLAPGFKAVRERRLVPRMAAQTTSKAAS